jgi:hypothetical protein
VIRRRTIWLAALVAIVAAIVLGAAAVVMLPDIVRRAAIWRLEALTNRRVTIERVDLNVLTGDVAVHGLRIADRDEPVDLVRTELIKARVHRRSLLELHVWIDELAIERSSVRIVRLSGTRFNISDLLERPSRPSGVGVTIDRLRVPCCSKTARCARRARGNPSASRSRGGTCPRRATTAAARAPPSWRARRCTCASRTFASRRSTSVPT